MKKNMPTVSIVVTNYNYSKYILRCLRSCLSQKHADIEIVLVDDASPDDSIDKINSFLPEINLIQNQKNLGVAESANKGIQAAKAQFVIRVDADDFVARDMCYIMSEYLELNHEAFCVSCDYLLVDEYENVLDRKYAETDNISCGIMYRRDLLIEMGGYNSNMRHREEEELRKRLGDKYKIHHLEIPFYRYRMHNTNKTKTKEYSETTI